MTKAEIREVMVEVADNHRYSDCYWKVRDVLEEVEVKIRQRGLLSADGGKHQKSGPTPADRVLMCLGVSRDGMSAESVAAFQELADELGHDAP